MAAHDSESYYGTGRKRGYDYAYGRHDDGIKKRKTEDVEYTDEPDEPPATLRILVRNQAAGGIIGKGGDNIKRLRKQYDCQVLLPDSPGAAERVMTMMGTIESCAGVLSEVLPQLGEGFMREVEGEKVTQEVQVLIPQPFMGTIIGTGGAKIKELRTRTRANIKIFSDPMPNSNERSIQLMGGHEQIVDCVQYFLDEISKKEPREPIYLYEPMPMSQGFGGNGAEESFVHGRGGRGRGHGPRSRGGGGRGSFHRDVPVSQWSSPRGGRGGRGRPPVKHEPPAATWRSPPSAMPQPGGYGGSSAPPPQPPPQYGNAPPPQQAPSRPPPLTSYPPPVSGHSVGYGVNQPNVGYAGSQPPASTQPPPRAPLVPQQQQQYLPPPSQVPQAQYRPPQQQAAPPPNPQGQSTQQVTIPVQYTDAILGKNGANLQQIRAQSSCEIVLDESHPGATERVITITGSPNGIQFAQQLMQNSVRQYHLV